MNLNTKKSNITVSLYIILTLCIISVAALSVYAFFMRQNSNNQEYGLENIESTERSAEFPDDIGSNGSEEMLRIFGDAAETPPATSNLPSKEAENTPDITNADNSTANQTPAAEINDAIQIAAPVSADTDTGTMNAVEVFSAPSVFLKPISGIISKPYNDEHPEYSVVMNDYRTHMGIDIESEVGSNVKAVADGIISEIVNDPMMGTTVVISHLGDVESLYMNLQEALPQNIVVGASIRAGDVIGGVGESALVEISEVPHLHYAMRKDGKYVNPLDYVQY